jgi:hypothetical protein
VVPCEKPLSSLLYVESPVLHVTFPTASVSIFYAVKLRCWAGVGLNLLRSEVTLPGG